MLRILTLLLACFLRLFSLELFAPSTLESLDSINPSEYYVSEKLDGIRAYWDGEKLLSRSGRDLKAPAWFIEHFPPFPIDGELYTQPREFERIVSIVKNQQNKDTWSALKLFVFEVPHQKGDLQARLLVLEKYLQTHSTKVSTTPAPIVIVPQQEFANLDSLKNFIREVQNQDGEGIILRKKHTPYQTGRRPTALKYKFFFDAECKIISYQQGKGKYANLVGSLLCSDGKHTFKVGSGMDESFRKSPPKIGTTITYKYYKKTKNDLPRHPIFLRVREDF